MQQRASSRPSPNSSPLAPSLRTSSSWNRLPRARQSALPAMTGCRYTKTIELLCEIGMNNHFLCCSCLRPQWPRLPRKWYRASICDRCAAKWARGISAVRAGGGIVMCRICVGRSARRILEDCAPLIFVCEACRAITVVPNHTEEQGELVQFNAGDIIAQLDLILAP